MWAYVPQYDPCLWCEMLSELSSKIFATCTKVSSPFLPSWLTPSLRANDTRVLYDYCCSSSKSLSHPRGHGVEPELDLQQHRVILVPTDVGVHLGPHQVAVLQGFRDKLPKK